MQLRAATGWAAILTYGSTFNNPQQPPVKAKLSVIRYMYVPAERASPPALIKMFLWDCAAIGPEAPMPML